MTKGTVDKVPCPSCGKPNDLRELESQQLLDTGHEIDCDTCGQMMEVAQIRMIKVVGVRRSAGAGPQAPRRQQVGAPRQATTLSPAQTRRLLGR